MDTPAPSWEEEAHVIARIWVDPHSTTALRDAIATALRLAYERGVAENATLLTLASATRKDGAGE